MTWRDYISLALVCFHRNGLRTLLSGLGIVISIASVIIVIAAAQGVKSFILGQFNAFGSNILNVETRIPLTGKNPAQSAQAQAFGTVVTSLKLDDMKALRRLPNIKTNYAGQIGQVIVTALGQKKTVNIYGVSPTYLDIDTGKIAAGRFFTEAEDESLARVAVLGDGVARDIFANINPIGQTIKLKQKSFTVIGVLAPRGTSLFMNFDDFVYVPVQTLQKQVLGIDYVSFILNQYEDPTKLPQTIAAAEDLMRQRHNIDRHDPDKDDFVVQSNEDVTNILDTVVSGFTILLVILAVISLVVGGVGIMNIMYVSVLERTFEIGLRKAVGATQKQILSQFLTEAVLVTLIGGITGIIVGIAVSYAIAAVAAIQGFGWNFVIPLYSVFLATGFAITCGLVFGLYPARRAANMDPIEALHTE